MAKLTPAVLTGVGLPLTDCPRSIRRCRERVRRTGDAGSGRCIPGRILPHGRTRCPCGERVQAQRWVTKWVTISAHVHGRWRTTVH